jgi:hypothetical protein
MSIVKGKSGRRADAISAGVCSIVAIAVAAIPVA